MKDITIYKVDKLSSLPLDFYQNPVCAGFPSPAEDHLDISLDLNEHLVRHPASTFYIYAKGNSMEGAGVGVAVAPGIGVAVGPGVGVAVGSVTPTSAP